MLGMTADYEDLIEVCEDSPGSFNVPRTVQYLLDMLFNHQQD